MIVLMMMMVTCAGPEWSLIVGPYKAQPNSPPTLSSSILFSNRTAADSLEAALLIPNSIATTTTTDCVCSPSQCGQRVQRRSWEIWSSASGLRALHCAQDGKSGALARVAVRARRGGGAQDGNKR